MRLTIVLPVCDRAAFTPRFVTAARSCARIVIADGGRLPQPDPGCDYFYAGYDCNLERWWNKMVMAFDRVDSDYAMVADNDDLIVPKGVDRCIEFLDQHPDYVACSGRLQGFWAWPDPVTGPHYARTRQYAMYDTPADYGQKTANQRVLAGFANSWSYYAVYRTAALRTIWNDVKDMNLSHLQIHEKFCAMRCLTLGKAALFPDFTSYLRQYGTSQVAATKSNWPHDLLASRFSYDVKAVVDRLRMHGVDGEALIELWAQWFEAFLKRNYGPWAQLRKAARRRLPWLADKVQNRHRYLAMKWNYR